MNNEQYIVDLLQAQDKRSIALLYDQYGASLYGVVLRIVGEEAIAEDVIQDTFLKVWRKAATYDRAKGTLFTWLLNIARNTAIDVTRSHYFRRRRTLQTLELGSIAPGQHSWQFNIDQIGLHNVVEELEEKYRIIIDLVYFNGYTQQEVQDELGIPLGTVKTRLKIGLRELRKVFCKTPIGLIAALALAVSSLFS